MSLIYMRMVDINDILYLIGGKVFQASTEAYMTNSECNLGGFRFRSSRRI